MDLEFYEHIKGWSTKRILRLRRMMRLIINPSDNDAERMAAINKELRLRTKRRYGKAV